MTARRIGIQIVSQFAQARRAGAIGSSIVNMTARQPEIQNNEPSDLLLR
jgi:F0F1-type ATP synthase membrane subunit c/vacuolar-type H+-ATPase subunit K